MRKAITAVFALCLIGAAFNAVAVAHHHAQPAPQVTDGPEPLPDCQMYPQNPICKPN